MSNIMDKIGNLFQRQKAAPQPMETPQPIAEKERLDDDLGLYLTATSYANASK